MNSCRTSSPASRLHPPPPPSSVDDSPTTPTRASATSFVSYKNVAEPAETNFQQNDKDFPTLPLVNGKTNPFTDLLIDSHGMSLSPNRAVVNSSAPSTPPQKGDGSKSFDSGIINPGILAAFEAADKDADAAIQFAATPLRERVESVSSSAFVGGVGDQDEDTDNGVNDEVVLPETRHFVTSSATSLEDVFAREEQEIYNVEDDGEDSSSEDENGDADTDDKTDDNADNNADDDEDDDVDDDEDYKQDDENKDVADNQRNDNDDTIPVIIHGIHDRVSASRLLNVHKSFKQDELDASVEEEQRIAAAMSKSTAAPSVMVNGRWVLTPLKMSKQRQLLLQQQQQRQQHAGQNVPDENHGKRRSRRKKKTRRRGNGLANGGDGTDGDGDSSNKSQSRGGKKRSRSAGVGNRLNVHMPLSVLTKHLQLTKEAEMLAAADGSAATSPRSPRSRKRSPKNQQPWNPVLTKVERERRELRNLRKKIQEQGLKVDFGRSRSGYNSGGENSNDSSPINARMRSKSTPTKGGQKQKKQRRNVNETTAERTTENDNRTKHAIGRGTRTMKERGILSYRCGVVSIFVVLALSVVVALLFGDDVGLLLTFINSKDNVGLSHVMEDVVHVTINTAAEKKRKDQEAKTMKPAMLPIQYPKLRWTYPGMGEIIFASDSIQVQWISTVALDVDTLYITIDGTQYKVDQEGYENERMNLLGMDVGVHTISLEGKANAGSNVVNVDSWFRVLPRPPTLSSDIRGGELNVLRALGSRTLNTLLKDPNVPDIRKTIMRNIIIHRNQGKEKDPGLEVEVDVALGQTITGRSNIEESTKISSSTTSTRSHAHAGCLSKCDRTPLGRYAKMACKKGCNS